MAPISAPRILATSRFSRLFLLLSLSILMHCNSSQHSLPNGLYICLKSFRLNYFAFSQWAFKMLNQTHSVFVTDDFITETPNPNSPMVGRGQGLYVTSALDGSSTHTIFSIVFTNQAYNGSTLEIQGTGKQFEVFETISMDMPRFHSVIQCNVTIRLD
ncbi:hypothetical protein ACJRO7_001657 [Eucalyptus globulus]|uniref:Dirigent protein n=1 Tax=Eucalyptus globulus TaxID=34317 RepID=A0ABD3LRR5_EUCGL